ncbi:MAG: ABC-type transporter, periplasmic subunit [Clostridiales bacterium]|nr:ABC-type transporter, periplasmic subunit [Clostridiales bacterium]
MKRLFASLIILTMLFSSCSKGTKQELSDVQEYSTVYSGEVTTLNYLVTASENEFAVAANLVDTLIDYDKYGVVKPCLATDWNVSEDGLTWTFNLRQGVKWMTNTGTEYAEVTAQDFVDAMKYVLDGKNNSSTANIAYGVLKNAEKFYNGEITDFSQVGVKAKDKYVLEYTLERPTPYFLSMLTYVCFFPANGKFLSEVGDKFGIDNVNLLYNGAYILDTFVPQNTRMFVANESYWDRENVFIGKLNYTFNKEAATLAPELFLRGEITGAEIPTASIDEWMKDPEKEKQVRPIATGYYTYFYTFNFDPKFDAQYEPDNWKIVVNNLNFRKSMYHGLDRKAAMLTSEPYDPERRLLNTITPKNFVSFNGKDYTKLGALAKITDKDSFDTKKAVDYKEKALKELEGKATFPVKVLMPYNTGSSDWTNRAQVVKQQLETALGKDYIEVILLPHPPTGFLNGTRRAGNYAFLECNWGPDYADPETYTDPFTPDSNYSWPHLATGYAEANGKNKYENLVNAAKAEVLDIEKRYSLFAEAEAFFINEALVIPYAVGGGGFIASTLDPFTSPYSPFGVSGNRFKGQTILAAPLDTETYNAGFAKWEKERAAALKAAEKK